MIQEPFDATTAPAAPPPPGPGAPPAYAPPAYAPPAYAPPAYAPPAYAPPGYAPPGFPPAGHRPPPGYVAGSPPALSPAGQPLATFLDRFLAHLIDNVVMLGVVMVLSVPALIYFFTSTDPGLFVVEPGGTVDQAQFLTFFLRLLLLELALFVVVLIVAYVYYVEIMFRSGQTLGKKALKLRVVPLDPAATLNRGFAAKRYLVQYVAGSLVPGLSYLDGLWQLWDKPYQQCLHDKFAGTVVVKVPA